MLSKATADEIYLIAREALGNAMRHSLASEELCELRYQENEQMNPYSSVETIESALVMRRLQRVERVATGGCSECENELAKSARKSQKFNWEPLQNLNEEVKMRR